MISLQELVAYTNRLLDIHSIRDYCPNGLQVEGRGEVHTLVAGVSASRDLIEAARERDADALLVHHGYFWKGEDATITGLKYQRIKTLIDSGISLLAYHLPLDLHAEYGNNVQLASKLGFEIEGAFGQPGGPDIGLYGVVPAEMSGGELASQIESALGRVPLHIAGSDRPIRRVGWCTGAAQGYIEQAVSLGLDAYLTGEVSEQTVHIARESGIHFFGAGHHATERYGAQALGQHLSEHFSLDYHFVDIDNPV
jgi:dinuclear metal center YbgI/SA1388 family protein